MQNFYHVKHVINIHNMIYTIYLLIKKSIIPQSFCLIISRYILTLITHPYVAPNLRSSSEQKIRFIFNEINNLRKYKKSAEAGCIKRLSSLNFWIFTALKINK